MLKRVYFTVTVKVMVEADLPETVSVGVLDNAVTEIIDAALSQGNAAAKAASLLSKEWGSLEDCVVYALQDQTTIDIDDAPCVSVEE